MPDFCDDDFDDDEEFDPFDDVDGIMTSLTPNSVTDNEEFLLGSFVRDHMTPPPTEHVRWSSGGRGYMGDG